MSSNKKVFTVLFWQSNFSVRFVSSLLFSDLLCALNLTERFEPSDDFYQEWLFFECCFWIIIDYPNNCVGSCSERMNHHFWWFWRSRFAQLNVYLLPSPQVWSYVLNVQVHMAIVILSGEQNHWAWSFQMNKCLWPLQKYMKKQNIWELESVMC